MLDYEKLGLFYLGKRYDAESRATLPEAVLYDSRDLTTHAVCLGMTGSGKTGLCVGLIEEAAIDRIPVLAIDPKGDIGNLLLTFPELRPADFRPWVDPDEARRRDRTPEEFAAETAERWREGLGEWDQPPERIARLRTAVDMAIYTPGSTAGRPLSLLQFAPPKSVGEKDPEVYRDRVASAASGLLALLGESFDPLNSREHILISNLLDDAWEKGSELNLARLIEGIQRPGFQKVGMLDLETFYPAAERFKLALRFNQLLAAPGFASWMQGEPLDIGKLLYTEKGNPRVSIISIAHLDETQRMAVVTLVLNEVLAWTRGQSGTSSLCAILYMDEVFGFFPPTAKPPSKTPMLTLLKQARAFGLGVVLATQNPMDLDYKGLSNAGTWFLGRLQTDRDKARVLEGLAEASAGGGGAFDRGTMDRLLSSLDKRVFVLRNVHESEPVLFQTRWTLSYLRGPLSRDQIKTLTARDEVGSGERPEAGPPVVTGVVEGPARGEAAQASTTGRPMLPPGIPEVFQSVRSLIQPGERLIYRPTLVGAARVHYVSARWKIDRWEEVHLEVPAMRPMPTSVWETGVELLEVPAFERGPRPEGSYGPLPAEFCDPKQYAKWERQLKDFLYRERAMSLWSCRALKLLSWPEEKEGDFRVRLAMKGREWRDEQIEALRKKYRPKLRALDGKIEKARAAVDREKSQASHSNFDAAVSLATSVLGALRGKGSRTSLSRTASTARAASRAKREGQDVQRAIDALDQLHLKYQDLELDLQREIDAIDIPLTPAAVADHLGLETVRIAPRKSEIDVERVVLAWVPWKTTPEGHTELA